MKTAANIFDLVKNSHSFACITPGDYILTKPLEIPNFAYEWGLYRLFLHGSIIRLASSLALDPIDMFIEGGTIITNGQAFQNSSQSKPALFFSGTVLIGSDPFADCQLNGSYWIKDKYI